MVEVEFCPLIGCLLPGDFLKTLEDPDLNVRRVALVTFNSAAHNKPSLIRELLDSILTQLYNETKVRKELIREVGQNRDRCRDAVLQDATWEFCDATVFSFIVFDLEVLNCKNV